MMGCRVKPGNDDMAATDDDDEEVALLRLVMRGLDPRIHPLRKTRRRYGRLRLCPATMMGCRVKPGNDERVKPGNQEVTARRQ
jgi:hypothetical protein